MVSRDVLCKDNYDDRYPRGGGVLNKFLCGDTPPRGPTPYPFIYQFSRKRYPFHIPSIEKLYPFHIPCLELCIPFNRCKCTVSLKLESITKIECFLDFIKPENKFIC